MSLRILVAEDNKFTAQQYKQVLENNGYEVVMTYDGKECVEKYVSELGKTEFESIDSHPFDLVILDHNMPKKSGTKAAKEILSKKPGQRILFASAYLTSFIEDQTGERITAQLDIIQKPFTLKALLRKIKSIEKSNK